MNSRIAFTKTTLGIREKDSLQSVLKENQLASASTPVDLPAVLIENGLYLNQSVANEFGIYPAYWKGESDKPNHTDAASYLGAPAYGPCFAYRETTDWEASMARYTATQQPWYNDDSLSRKDPTNLQGYCRPGFLIIGKSELEHRSCLSRDIASHKTSHRFASLGTS